MIYSLYEKLLAALFWKIANILLSLVQKPPHRVLEEKFISFLQSCRTHKQLLQIHGQIIAHGFEENEYVTPTFFTACAALKKMAYARKAFDQIPDRSTALWNAMFRGYSQNDSYWEVIVLFFQMNRAGALPSCFTFPIVLRSCGKVNATTEGEEVHCFVIKGGYKSNPFVATTLIDMYSARGSVGAAYKVFGGMLDRNVVAWTSMINAYVGCHDIVSARRLFDLAPERDIILWNTMISGYIELGDMAAARQVFDNMPNRDIMSWNTILSGYATNGDVESCEKLFKDMPQRNVFSWNGMIGGYARNGRFSEVLDSFKQMLIEADVLPNDATLVTVLSACSRLGALDMGKWVHMYADGIGLTRNQFVGNALIDMYAKCGNIESAIDVFNTLDRKDIITWNTIINGLAIHGHAVDALSLFDRMKNAGEKPDGVTFVGILAACTHMGLVQDGFSYFQSMVDCYSLVPQIEHYGCMVDLLGRAGLLDQAIDFVRKMPMKPDSVIWASLLGACRIYKNVDLAELALQQLIDLEPNNPANFVVLSNIYKDLGRWQDVARLKVAIRDTGFKKQPGCSVIEVNDNVVEFYSLDERHPDTEDIYRTLRGLTMLLRSYGYVPNLAEIGRGT